MEKIILVFYINVGNCTPSDRNDFMKKTIDSLKPELDENGILAYFVPTIDGDSKVECINPKLITPEEYKHAKSKLDENQYKIDQIIKDLSKN